MSARSVLVVDDHLPSVELMEAYLQPEGFRVIKARDGDEAMKQIAANPPDLVLLDALMPRVSGYEVCRHIKSNSATHTIPVVMITSLKDPADRARSLAEGADDFLTKPVGRLELLTRVRSLMRIRKLQEELNHCRAELVKADEVRALPLGAIVHDLKNSLTVVESNLELIEIKKMQGAQQQLDTSRRHCRILFHMIQDISEVSKLEAGTLRLSLKKVEMGDLIRKCAGEFAISARAKEREIALDLSPDLPEVEGDIHLLYRVIFNLLAGAIRYGGQAGDISITARAEGGAIRVAVAVPGEAMPTHFLGKAFEKTAYLDENGQAMRGLSLAFCKLAVEAHGGRMWAESEADAGNRMVFELPAST